MMKCNMQEPITSIIISKWIISIVWAFFGGLVHALMHFRKGKIKGKADFLSLAFVSGFAGMMFGLIALKFYPTDVWVIAFASGAGGFTSLEGLSLIISKFIQNKISIKLDKE